jgi:hypothetical protein
MTTHNPNRVIQWRGRLYCYLEDKDEVYSFDPATNIWITWPKEMFGQDLEIRDGGIYIRETPLEAAPKPKDCTCDLVTVIMRVGCQCGGQ